MKNTNTKTCSIENCDKGGRLKRGWCGMHYRRWQVHGDPHTVLRDMTYSPEEALEKKTEQQGDCLIWTGTKHDGGYGMILVDGKQIRVHRYVWEQEYGAIPPKMHIDHICHIRTCCNIKHLRLAKPNQNSSHRSGIASHNVNSKVRNVYPNGDGWQVKLTKNQKIHRFGTYSTIEEAASVAEQARSKLFGEYAGRG